MSETYEINFVWPHTEANDVVVIGNFDSWDPSNGHRLKRFDSGFEGKVLVPWGFKVLYKFLVDGEWLLLENHPTEVDPIGNVNNVYEVPPKPESVEMHSSQTSDVIGPATAKSTIEAAAITAATTAKELTLAAKDAVVAATVPLVSNVTAAVSQAINGNGILASSTSEDKSITNTAEVDTDKPVNTDEVVEQMHQNIASESTVVADTKVEEGKAFESPAVEEIKLEPVVLANEDTKVEDVKAEELKAFDPPAVEEIELEPVVLANEETKVEDVKTEDMKVPEAPIAEKFKTEPEIIVEEEFKVEKEPVIEVKILEEVQQQQSEPTIVEPIISQPEVIAPSEKPVDEELQIGVVGSIDPPEVLSKTAADVPVPILPVMDAATNGIVDTGVNQTEVDKNSTEIPSTHTPATTTVATTDDSSRPIPPAVAGTEVELDAPILPTTVAAPAEKTEDKLLETVPVSSTTNEASTSMTVDQEVEAKPPTPEKDVQKITLVAPVDTSSATLEIPSNNGTSTPAPPTPIKHRFPSGSGLDDGTGSVHSSKSGTPRKKKLSIFGKIKEVFQGAEDKILHHGHSRRASSTNK